MNTAITRRPAFVLAALLLVLPMLAGAVEAETPGSGPRVVLDGETWEGAWVDDGGRFAVFRGIPYAAPPVGERRWQPPARRSPEPGVHPARDNGPACFQTQRLVAWDRSMYRAFGLDESRVPALENISEDCLYLNVWTPAPEEGENLPVMVWIYGGSNRSGWAHQSWYDGASLARRGVVSVFINYRVGVFGWFSHPALSRESVKGVSGNYAILDQVAALEWVQRNIERLGGDPGRVTIAGESAGGVNVATLLASPLAQGLFDRAIIQSGGFPGKGTLEGNETLGVAIMQHLGVGPSGDDDRQLRDMRALDAGAVLAASNEVRGSIRYAPVIDGYVLPATTMDIFGLKIDDPPDVVIGANAHEMSLFMPRLYAHKPSGLPDEADFSQALATYASSEVDGKVLRGLLAKEGDVYRRTERLHTIGWFLCPSIAAARQLSLSGHKVYYYYFTREREGQKIWAGAHHAAEIPYVFDTGNHIFPSTEIDIELGRVMGDYWANFIASGDPNGGNLPTWPVFEPGRAAYMNFGDGLSVGEALEPQVCGAVSIPY